MTSQPASDRVAILENEFRYTPLWILDGSGRINVDPLASFLSQELSEKILHWDDEFQEAFDKYICQRKPLAQFLDIQQFNSEGAKLIQDIGKEISPTEVKYVELIESLYHAF